MTSDLWWLLGSAFVIAANAWSRDRLTITVIFLSVQSWFALLVFGTSNPDIYYGCAAVASSTSAFAMVLHWSKVQMARDMAILSAVDALWHISGWVSYHIYFAPDVYNAGCKVLLFIQLLRLAYNTPRDRKQLHSEAHE